MGTSNIRQQTAGNRLQTVGSRHQTTGIRQPAEDIILYSGSRHVMESSRQQVAGMDYSKQEV